MAEAQISESGSPWAIVNGTDIRIPRLEPFDGHRPVTRWSFWIANVKCYCLLSDLFFATNVVVDRMPDSESRNYNPNLQRYSLSSNVNLIPEVTTLDLYSVYDLSRLPFSSPSCQLSGNFCQGCQAQY